METSRIAELLQPFAAEPLSDSQLQSISAYLDLLLRWNARMNLTAVRDEEHIVTRHFGESLFAAQQLFPAPTQPAGQRLIDIGSGAGFPGLPIKLWNPALKTTLIESNHKKATFLREVVRSLSLSDVEVLAHPRRGLQRPPRRRRNPPCGRALRICPADRGHTGEARRPTRPPRRRSTISGCDKTFAKFPLASPLGNPTVRPPHPPDRILLRNQMSKPNHLS